MMKKNFFTVIIITILVITTTISFSIGATTVIHAKDSDDQVSYAQLFKPLISSLINPIIEDICSTE